MLRVRGTKREGGGEELAERELNAYSVISTAPNSYPLKTVVMPR